MTKAFAENRTKGEIFEKEKMIALTEETLTILQEMKEEKDLKMVFHAEETNIDLIQNIPSEETNTENGERKILNTQDVLAVLLENDSRTMIQDVRISGKKEEEATEKDRTSEDRIETKVSLPQEKITFQQPQT